MRQRQLSGETMTLSRGSLLAATPAAVALPRAAFAQEKVVR
jgi:hypothetical protein